MGIAAVVLEPFPELANRGEDLIRERPIGSRARE